MKKADMKNKRVDLIKRIKREINDYELMQDCFPANLDICESCYEWKRRTFKSIYGILNDYIEREENK